MDFDVPGLFSELSALGAPERFDDLPFGLVAMRLDGTITAYNRYESECTGFSAAQCVGLNFFTDVGQCTNNFLVSGRFDEETTLDETIDYVFTLKMRPTRVRLRLLKDEPSPHQFIAIQRR
ncbi:MAG: hypothetical protein IAI49_08380 [Candidatus Eremiobacteraeota bacterium]|nr:hypothetical protein [Candidatus Eremiobacteraeota bacterium]